MRLEELDYKLPEKLIAKHPLEPRDSARLLSVDKKSGALLDSHFYDLTRFLKKGDVLVFNKTKVFPARVILRKKTGGRIEIVFLRELEAKKWEVIIGGKLSTEEELDVTKKLKLKIAPKDRAYAWVNLPRQEVLLELEKAGEMPLPPYIKRRAERLDKENYQTVFADSVGSAAAPTAGLHFTRDLIKRIKSIGVEVVYVDLAVGLGTFAPVKTELVEDHPIHSEYFEVSKKSAEIINMAKKDGRRVIACGTTVCRALESAVKGGEVKTTAKETKLFIYPGYDFKIVDGLITNFHTPRSSLLALVYAFVGQEITKKAYSHAIKKGYRFFSYGDGMIIL